MDVSICCARVSFKLTEHFIWVHIYLRHLPMEEIFTKFGFKFLRSSLYIKSHIYIYIYIYMNGDQFIVRVNFFNLFQIIIIKIESNIMVD